MFKPSPQNLADVYKFSHPPQYPAKTQVVYSNTTARSSRMEGVDSIVVFGTQYLVEEYFIRNWNERFFSQPKEKVVAKFKRMMDAVTGKDSVSTKTMEDLHDLGYLPIRIKSLPEGIETAPNIPHMTFVNTVSGFAWLTLYLETIVSSLAWKPSTSATIALQYKRNLVEWVMKTDPANAWLIPFLAHDFSARGLSPWDMLSSGLGHASSFRGSDSIIVIPGARYYYGEPQNEVCINSVNASEHSVSTTRIFSILNDLENGNADWLIEEYENFNSGI